MAKVAEKSSNSAIKREVAKAFREVFSDPDFGLELRPDFVRRMKKSIASANAGKVTDLREFLRKK